MKREMKYTLCLWMLSAAFSACTDMLRERPQSEFDLNDYWGGKYNETKLDVLLVGAYGGLQNAVGANSFVGVAGTDDMKVYKSNIIATPQDSYTYNADMAVFRTNWRNYFKIINDANLVINRAFDADDIGDNFRKSVIAQARFLRAYAYFYLVRTYGELPILLEETKEFDKTMMTLPRSSLSDVYAVIISDLEFAAMDGMLTAETNSGRVNVWAAKTLLAKVYLTIGTYMDSHMDAPVNPVKLNCHTYDPLGTYNAFTEGWHKIDGYKQMCQQGWTSQDLYFHAYSILYDIYNSNKFELQSNYADIFNFEKKNTLKEIIWEIQFSEVPGYGSNWSKQFGCNSGTAERQFNGMAGNQVYTCVPGFWFRYKQDDLRRNWNTTMIHINGNAISASAATESLTVITENPSVMLALINNTWLNEHTNMTKYRWGSYNVEQDPDRFWSINAPFDQNNCPNNYPVLRYADVLLMLVECDMLLNGGNPTQLALNIVNSVLYRARGNRTEADSKAYAIASNPALATFSNGSFLRDYNQTDNPLTYDKLIDERSLEFVGEFQRWFDLARTGRLKDRVEHRQENVSMLGKVDPRKHYLFPIPAQERAASENKDGFFQNPGFSGGEILP